MTDQQLKLAFSSQSEEWATPTVFFEELDKEFHFDLDVCATPENAKCVRYYTRADDGLKQAWSEDGSVIWCNPPYGRQISAWVRKAYEEMQKGATVVMLVFARTETRWFHEYIYGKAEIRFVKGRIHFSNSKNPAPSPSMVVIFRKKVDL